MDYTQETGAQDLEPATAYAYYCGARGESLQNVIWYSKLWTGGTNSVVDASSGVAGISQRYKAYGDVYYGIIKPFQNINSTNKSLFSITSDTKEENVKVMVNQQNKKYIVGPYKIELKPNIPNVTVNLSEINNEQEKQIKALAAKLKEQAENVSKDASITPSSIQLGDFYVDTTHEKAYIGLTAINITNDYGAYEKTKTSVYNAQKECAKAEEAVAGAKDTKSKEEAIEEFNSRRKKLKKAQADYTKVSEIVNAPYSSIAMQLLIQKYNSTDKKGTLNLSEFETKVREYLKNKGIDLKGQDSALDFSTDDMKKILVKLEDSIEKTSEYFTSEFKDDTLTITVKKTADFDASITPSTQLGDFYVDTTYGKAYIDLTAINITNDYGVYEQIKTSVDNAQKEYNDKNAEYTKAEEAVAGAKDIKSKKEAQEELDKCNEQLGEAEEKLKKAQADYTKVSKIFDASYSSIAMQLLIQKYNSTDKKGTLKLNEFETKVREYLKNEGIDLKGQDSTLDFSTDDMKAILDKLINSINSTSKSFTAANEYYIDTTTGNKIDTLTITDKKTAKQITQDDDYYYNLAKALMQNDTDENYLDLTKTYPNGYNVTSEAKKALYNELINWRKINNSFATFDITKDLQGINGDPNSYRFLDSNGNEIQFPDFVSNKEFYIEFTPNNDGNVQYIGIPTITIHWLDDFSYLVNGKWAISEIKSVEGVPTEYDTVRIASIETTSDNSESNQPTFHMEKIVNIPVKVGTGQKQVQVDEFTIKNVSLYFTSGARKTYKPLLDGNGKQQIDKNGNALTTFDKWETDSNWSIDTTKITKVWTVKIKKVGDVYYIQNIDGDIYKNSEKIKIYSKISGNGLCHWNTANSNLEINKSCNVQIGGTVWLESPEQKTANIDGKLGNGDVPFAGIQVQLYDVTQGTTAVIGGNGNQGKLVAITTTDKNGHYRFFGTNDTINGSYTDTQGTKRSMRELLLNPLHKYYVIFVYNGQLYQPTYYHKQLTSPGYSNAKDMSREEFNAKFTRIDSDTANYKSPGANAWNRAYSAKHKLKTNDGSYISFNNGALTYEDAWKQFLIYATNTRNYDLNPKEYRWRTYMGSKW